MGTHFHGTKKEIRALDAYIKLMKAAKSATSRIHRHLKPWNLTTGQLAILDALYHLGPLSQRDLAEKILVTSGNITMVVDNLEKRSLVERIRRSEDRRFVTVHLTDKGASLFEEMFLGHVERIVAEMDALTGLEQEELGRLCRKLGSDNGVDRTVLRTGRRKQ
jgi:MarR family 2-MHQ and catechol resistance regulon transcriptional repressor